MFVFQLKFMIALNKCEALFHLWAEIIVWACFSAVRFESPIYARPVSIKSQWKNNQFEIHCAFEESSPFIMICTVYSTTVAYIEIIKNRHVQC